VDLVRNYSEKDSIAHFLNSSLNKTERTAVIKDIKSGITKMLYVAPETLTKQDTVDLFKEVKVSFIAIDEAHCISEWGHDFRPEYRRIREIISAIKQDFPLIALTATATPKVQRRYCENSGAAQTQYLHFFFLTGPTCFMKCGLRKHHSWPIKNMVQFIKQHPGKSGIVYVINRKTADDLSQVLARQWHKGGRLPCRARWQGAHPNAGRLFDGRPGCDSGH
jgi:ATP-dependent DNA helicase RecQ